MNYICASYRIIGFFPPKFMISDLAAHREVGQSVENVTHVKEFQMGPHCGRVVRSFALHQEDL